MGFQMSSKISQNLPKSPNGSLPSHPLTLMFLCVLGHGRLLWLYGVAMAGMASMAGTRNLGEHSMDFMDHLMVMVCSCMLMYVDVCCSLLPVVSPKGSWLTHPLSLRLTPWDAYPSGPTVFAAHLSYPAGSLMWSLSLPGAPWGAAKLWCSVVCNVSPHSVCISLRKIVAKQPKKTVKHGFDPPHSQTFRLGGDSQF